MRKYKLITITFFTVLFISSCSNLKNKYEYLLTPQIINIPKQKMLVLEVKGDPNNTAKYVGDLYKGYFKLDFKNKKMIAPRARWPKPFDTKLDEWIGIWALPIPEEVNTLPDIETDFPFRFEYWYDCDVAEILHIGPYENETPTIKKLKKHITDLGYEYFPDKHEEEYIKGPGFFGKGNTKKYLTIIRYELKKNEVK